MSIRMKILLSIVVSIMVTLGSAVVVVYVGSQNSVVENYRETTQVQLKVLAEYTNLFLDNALSMIHVLATSPHVVSQTGAGTSYIDSKQEMTPRMADLPTAERQLAESFLAAKKSFSAYDMVYFGGVAGDFTQAPDDVLSAGFDPRTRPWFKEAKAANGKPILSEIYRSVNGVLVVSASCAVYDAKGDFIGVVGMDINLTEITKFLGLQGVGKTGHTIVCDEMGLIISDPDNSDRLYKHISNVGIPDLPKLFDMRQGMTTVTIDGLEHYSVVFSSNFGWRLFSFIEADELSSNAMGIVRTIEYIGLLIVILLSLAGLVVASSIVNPVNRLVLAAQGVAAGDMNAVPKNARFDGELKFLYQSMRSMVEQLASLIQTANTKTLEAEAALEQGKQALHKAEVATEQAVNARREGVEQTVSQLGGVVSDLGKVGDQLGNQAGTMTSSVESQLDRTSETALAMDHVKNSINDVARNARSVAELAENAKREALAGQRMVHDVISSITKVDALAVHMNDSVIVLGQQANDIGKVMNIITDVADQTNLLALNAAIEAARAGEAGRGFAVVADEVRKLAEKTMEATRSVGSAVNAIQQGAETNRQAIAQSAQEVSNSTALAHEAGEALTRITSLVSDTNTQVHAIAGVSQEQSGTVEQISRYTAEINTMATSVAESVRESSKTIMSLNKLTNKLQTVITELQK